MSTNATSSLNLKAVLQETGLTADTLRAWERRYGLPTPERSPGGHRLYSHRDIEIIKWLISKQEDGLSISRAVDLWNDLTTDNHDPLAEEKNIQAINTSTFPSSGLENMRNAWVQACMKFSESEAENVLNQAFSMYQVEQVCLEILQSGVAEVGNYWYMDQATVQQEHFASSLAMRRLDALLAATPLPYRTKTILVGCPPEEWHAFMPLMLTLFLRRRGLNTIYLGANVPQERFTETANFIKPNLVVLTAQQLHSAANLNQVAHILHEIGIPTCFGGRIFNIQPTLSTRIPAHFLGLDINQAIETIEQILAGNYTVESPSNLPAPFEKAIASFTQRRHLVEARVTMNMPANGHEGKHILTANQSMGDKLVSALKFGDLNLLNNEFDWIEGLLGNVEIDPAQLYTYMHHYQIAISTELGEDGLLIIDWIENMLEDKKELIA